MAIQKFEMIKSTAVPLPIQNIDTDQIIPARFLKAVERKGFGENLFRDWRFDNQNNPKPDFVLNNPMFSGQVLIAGANFGSGSSREHAAWALFDYGFRVVISSFFADIFKNNALNNGLLPIQVPEILLDQLLNYVLNQPQTLFQVDLAKQKLMVLDYGIEFIFDINPFKKDCLLKGFDDLDYVLSLKNKIVEFEKKLMGHEIA